LFASASDFKVEANSLGFGRLNGASWREDLYMRIPDGFEESQMPREEEI
jgi:hypothetical protein